MATTDSLPHFLKAADDDSPNANKIENDLKVIVETIRIDSFMLLL